MIEVMPAKDGNKTLKKDGIYLLSQYNPEQDVVKFFDRQAGKFDNSFYVLFGGMLGYPVEYLLKKGVKQENIIIFEPERDLEMDLSGRFHGCFFINKNSSCFSIFESQLLSHKKPAIIVLESYKKAYDCEYGLFLNFIQTEMKTAIENLKVSAYFSKVWFINFIRNMTGCISEKRFKFMGNSRIPSGMKVLVTAAGPSLSEYLADIRLNCDKLIILSVLSSARTLLESGINPDFLVVSDAGAGNMLHAFDIPEEIPVFASVYSSSSLLSSINNPVIFYDFEQETGNPSFRLKYPSVTIDAGILAGILTGASSDIIFCGFDLAFSRLNGGHSRNNALFELREKNYTRISPKLSSLCSFMPEKDLIPADRPGYFTNPRLVMVKIFAEKCFKNSLFLNGGTNFAGMRKISSLSEIQSNNLKNGKSEKLETIKQNFVPLSKSTDKIKGTIDMIKKRFFDNEIDMKTIFTRETLTGSDLDKLSVYYGIKITKLSAYL